jgi:hypothetical protein
MVTIDSRPLFDFLAYSNTRLPINILASFCFQDTTVNIPNTEIGITVPSEHWVFTDPDKTDIFILSFDDFSEIYLGANKKSIAYFDFITDTLNNDVDMNFEYEEEDLLSSDLSEEIEFANWFGMKGEIYLENNKPCLNLVHEADFKPMNFKDRVIVAWNILTNKNFKFNKVSMDWV